MQEMKTAVKAIAATAVGALMLGATLAGAAMAAAAPSLGDFPTPFVKDGAWSGKLVLGKVAMTEDLVGALDIAAALGQQTVKIEAAAGTGTVDLSISGTQGKQYDIAFGVATDASEYFGAKLTSTDMPMLFDGKTRATGTGTQFRGHEEVSLDGFGGAQRITPQIYEDESKIKLDVQQLSLMYKFVFDDQISDIDSNGWLTCAGDFDPSNGLKKIEVPTFLGKKLTFTCLNTVDAWTNYTGSPYITVEQGDYQTLKPGDSYKSGDYTVKVASVDTSSTTGKVSITVTGPTGNSESKILNEGTSYQFLSGGIEVKANAVIKDAAELIIGTTVSKTINNNDAEGWYSNKDYRVRIGSTGNDRRKPVVEIAYKYPYGTTERVGVNALNAGDKISFVNDAFQLQYVGNKGTLASDPIKIEKTSDLAWKNETQATTSVAAIKVTWPSTADVYLAPGTTTPTTILVNVTADSASASAERANYMLVYTQDGGRHMTVSYQDTKGTVKFASNYTAANVTLSDLKILTGLPNTLLGGWNTPQTFIAKIADGKYKDTPFSIWLNYTANSGYMYNSTGAGNTVYLYLNASTTDATKQDIVSVRLMHAGAEFTRVGSSTTPVDADAYYASRSAFSSTANTFAATGGSVVGATADKAIGAKDKNYITMYGMKVSAPKTSLGSGDGSLSIYLPDVQDKAKILLGKSATTSYKAKKKGDTVSGVSVDDISVTEAKKATVVPISVPVASLDTEINDKTANNMILVGGPSVNSLVKDLGMKKEDFKDASGNAIGKLILKDGGFAAGKQVLVVAGWDAANTRAASYVLAHYASYADTLKGKTEVTVGGTELTTSALTVA